MNFNETRNMRTPRILKNLLLSEAIGDIAGQPYEFHNRTKDVSKVDLLLPYNDYTDDTVCTFACADALLHHKDMAKSLWRRGREDFNRGFGGNYARWLTAPSIKPSYGSCGNGSAMRCSAAGFMAKDVEQCIKFAIETALPTHDHPEGIKGAVTTALSIFFALEGKSKEFIRKHVLDVYYPIWSYKTYEGIKPGYHFDETCQLTVPAALICFLESSDYVDCLKRAIALGGDADTLAAIAGPIAYAYYKYMPEELIMNAKRKLPQWMLELNDEFDAYCNREIPCEQPARERERIYRGIVRPFFTPEKLSVLKDDEVFVFGSNLLGHHEGGAALAAMKRFGATWGKGVGIQGQSYAIPTIQGGPATIKPYVDDFIEYACQHKGQFFYVTRIGCGIAGFSDAEIAPLFRLAQHVENICLPKSFAAIIEGDDRVRR